MINAQRTNGKSTLRSAPPKIVPMAKTLGNPPVNGRPMASIALGYKLESDRSAILDTVRDGLIRERANDPRLTRGEKCIEDFI